MTPRFFSLAQYKLFKKTADDDKDRGLLNAHKAGLTGALAGLLLGKGTPAAAGAGRLATGIAALRTTRTRRIVSGYVAGQAAVHGTRVVTAGTKDAYGDRSRAAKHAEKAPMWAGLAGAGLLAKKRLTGKFFATAERELPPWSKMGLSAGATGLLAGGILSGLRRGSTLRGALRSAATTGAVTGTGVAAAGALGSRLLGPARADDKTAYTKRGAAGGAVGGAVLGGVGALALLKSRAGRRRLAGAARRWRPAQWVKDSPAAVAAGVGAGTGALAGAYQAADEGMQVDVLESLRQQRRVRALTARLFPVLFSREQIINDKWVKINPLAAASGEQQGYKPRIDTNGQYVRGSGGKIKLDPHNVGVSHAQVLRSAYNQGVTINRYGGRAGRLGKDAVGAFRGEKKVDERGRPMKREWEKSWFRNAAGAALIGGGLIANAHAMKKFPRYRAKVVGAKTWVKAKANKLVPDSFPVTTQGYARQLRGMILFDAWAEEKGWDVRDPRGRSARVFAPGSRRRDRREKKSYETVGFLRKAAVAAGVGALALGGVGGYLLGKRTVKAPIIKTIIKKPRPKGALATPTQPGQFIVHSGGAA